MRLNILILSLFILLFNTALFSAKRGEPVRLTSGSYHIGDIEGFDRDKNYSENIRVLEQASWGPFANLKMPKTDSHYIWLRLELPYPGSIDDMLFIERVEQNFQLIADGNVIYQYGELDESEKRFIGIPNHYIPLQKKGINRVYLRIHSNSPIHGVYGKILYGTGYHILRRRLPRILASATQVGIFLLCALITFVFYVKYWRDSIFIVFSGLIFFFSIFSLMRARIPYLFIGPEHHLLLFHLHCISLVMIGFLFFLLFRYIIGPGIFNTNRYLGKIYLVLALATEGMALPGIIDPPTVILYFEAACLPLLIILIAGAIPKILSQERDVRIFSSGLVVCSVLTMIDIINIHSGNPAGFNYTSAGFFVLVLAIFIIVIYRVIKIHVDLESAYDKISQKEKKYRIIIESTDDLIFTIDESFHITSCNNSFKNLVLGNSFADVDGAILNIFDYIYNGQGMNNPALILNEKLQETLKSKQSSSVKVHLVSGKDQGLIETTIHLECIVKNDREEILCRGMVNREGRLTRYLREEKLQYKFINDFSLANDITDHITRNLAASLDKSTIMQMRFALYEVFINAVEHGNLNITYDEKSDLLEKEEYMSLIKERSRILPYVGRSVTVRVHIASEKAEYWISDEGEGFDFEKMLNIDPDSATSHGRGLVIVKTIFDVVEFLHKGRTAHLIKYF